MSTGPHSAERITPHTLIIGPCRRWPNRCKLRPTPFIVAASSARHMPISVERSMLAPPPRRLSSGGDGGGGGGAHSRMPRHGRASEKRHFCSGCASAVAADVERRAKAAATEQAKAAATIHTAAPPPCARLAVRPDPLPNSGPIPYRAGPTAAS